MRKRLFAVFLTSFVLLCLGLSAGCDSAAVTPPTLSPGPAALSETAAVKPSGTPAVTSNTALKLLTVTFLDVGQGDCILILTPNGKTMLIDAGEADSQQAVNRYLQRKGVRKIDVLVATHPHADHIGGMAYIVKHYEIGTVYMPKVTATTKTYEDLLTAIQDKGLAIRTAKAGVAVDLDETLSIEMEAPNAAAYEDINDYSAVIRLTYDKTSFLFMGDASALSEKEMLHLDASVQADVLKVGHHGSQTSSSAEFVSAVSPSIAVISVGKGNPYGHPSQQTLQRLHAAGTVIYRTDRHGTVTVTSDGATVSVSTSLGSHLKRPWLHGRSATGWPKQAGLLCGYDAA